MHQVIKFPFSVPPAWKKVYAAMTVCFPLHCFIFFFYLFVLCFCHSDLICATDSVVSPTLLLPAGKELMPGTDDCWWVCKAKLWFLFNSIFFFLFCPLGLALMPHRQRKCSVPKLLICYVIYLLHIFFFHSSQPLSKQHIAGFSWFFWGTSKCYALHSIRNLLFNCIKEERACRGRGKRRISHTADFSDHWEGRGGSLHLSGQFT